MERAGFCSFHTRCTPQNMNYGYHSRTMSCLQGDTETRPGFLSLTLTIACFACAKGCCCWLPSAIKYRGGRVIEYNTVLYTTHRSSIILGSFVRSSLLFSAASGIGRTGECGLQIVRNPKQPCASSSCRIARGIAFGAACGEVLSSS